MTDQQSQLPPAGWYDHPSMDDTLRYWDGRAWTDHIAPAHGQGGPKRPCPYCRTSIPATATRCSGCAGELSFCPKCQAIQPVGHTSINVGLLRGGRAQQTRCAVCNTRLAGPAF